MWIRSQDNQQIIQVNNIYRMGSTIYSDVAEGKYKTLGTYKSSERAVAVLDMIHQHINNYQYSIITGEHYVSKIFVMPEK